MSTQNDGVCKSCHSRNLRLFDSELGIHFSGLEGLTNPLVMVFPKLRVCLDCGYTEFTLPERELLVIKEGSAVEGAIICERESQEAG